MSATSPRFPLTNGIADTKERQRKDRAARGWAVGMSVLLVIALSVAAWFVVTHGVRDASAVAVSVDAQSIPQVQYFPSLYINQATAIEPLPATH